MKRFAVVCLLVVTSALFFDGCAGKTGPTGPAGAAGPTGSTGPDAKYYDFSLVFSPTVASGYFSLAANTTYTSIDAVITYWKKDVDTYIQLPYTWYNPGYTVAYFYTYIDLSGGIPWLYVVSQKGDNIAGSPWASTSTFYFRTIVIKGSAGKSAPNIDYSNYQEAKKYYNLPD